MKKFLATLSMFGLAFTAQAGTSFCGIDIHRAAQDNLPATYCYAKQEAGDQTFGGQIHTKCQGSACPAANSVNTL
jgi:hypothetical protein